jgi:hypothetical protein
MSLLAVEAYRKAGRGQPRVYANYLDVSHGQLPEAAIVTRMGRVLASLLSNIVSIVSLHP